MHKNRFNIQNIHKKIDSLAIGKKPYSISISTLFFCRKNTSWVTLFMSLNQHIDFNRLSSNHSLLVCQHSRPSFTSCGEVAHMTPMPA